MSKKLGAILLAVVVLTTAFLTSCSGTDLSASEIFSSMETVDLNGKKVDSSVFAENKLTLVNLWNIGCTPCVQELPVLDEINKEYAEKGVAIKGLYFSATSTLSDEESAAISEVLEMAGAEYQQLTLSEAMINDEVIKGIQAFPTTFVVDSNGKILKAVEGSNDYDGWKAFIESELAKVQ